MATKTYTLTYKVDLEDNVEFPENVATFWLTRVLANPDLNLPDYVYSVTTVPQVQELKPKPEPKPKTKG